MDSKNKLFISLAVIALIAAAVLTSFGRTLLALNTPSIQLPDLSGDTSYDPGAHSGGSIYLKVEVTPQTVQKVIATLTRANSYYRELTVETIWADGSSEAAVQIWTDSDWSHSRRILPSGVIRHDLVGNDTLHYWYEGSSLYKSIPADELSADLSQRLPTYETVLALEAADITAAGYQLRGELPCVYVEVTSEQPATLTRYWISVDSGLLVSAEVEQDGQLIYRMSAYSPVTTPCPPTASFSLPDGQSLHSVS